MSDWDELGGETGVRALVQAFVDRVFDDMIIGFLFVGKDRDRIVQHELELASVHLGGPLGYRGRPIGPLHRALRINAGQFRRRLAVLRTVLRERGVAEEVVSRWVAHDQRLQPVVTDGTDCAGP
ncbi:MAG: group 1 truncated hemoglobin [Alphaproteobacteria bacterium]|nr:group 1 truncated hemoglobin [Alphaproteobacteria bacterium]